MPTIAQGASASVTLAAGQVITGNGAGTATYNRITQPLTSGDAWEVGPFDRSTVVELTAAFGPLEYTAEAARNASLTAAQVAAGATGVVGDASGALLDAQGNALAHKPSRAYLACIPGRQFVSSGVPKDLSDNNANGVLGSALTDAALWANAGYMTTAAAANTNVQIPLAKSTFNLGSESVIFSVLMKKAAPAGNDAAFGNGDAASGQGVYLSVRATTGKIRPVINTSGGVISGLTDSAAAFADGADHVVTVALDAVTKQVFLWRDGALSDAYAANWTGTTTPTTAFFLGSAASGTGVVAQFAGVHLLKFSGGLPLNMNAIAARLAARPFDYLTDLDIYRA